MPWLWAFMSLVWAPVVEEVGKRMFGVRFTVVLVLCEAFQTFLMCRCVVDWRVVRLWTFMRAWSTVRHFQWGAMPSLWRAMGRHAYFNVTSPLIQAAYLAWYSLPRWSVAFERDCAVPDVRLQPLLFLNLMLSTAMLVAQAYVACSFLFGLHPIVMQWLSDRCRTVSASFSGMRFNAGELFLNLLGLLSPFVRCARRWWWWFRRVRYQADDFCATLFQDLGRRVIGPPSAYGRFGDEATWLYTEWFMSVAGGDGNLLVQWAYGSRALEALSALGRMHAYLLLAILRHYGNRLLDLAPESWRPRGMTFMLRFTAMAPARFPPFQVTWNHYRALTDRWRADAYLYLEYRRYRDTDVHIHLGNTADIIDAILDLVEAREIDISLFGSTPVGRAWVPAAGETRLVLPAMLFAMIVNNHRGYQAKTDSFIDFANYVTNRDDGGFPYTLDPQTAERLLLAFWTAFHAQSTLQLLTSAVQVYHALYPGRAITVEVAMAMATISNEYSAAGPDPARALADTAGKVMKLLFLRPYLAAGLAPLPESVHRAFRTVGSACKDSPALAEELATLLEMVFIKLPRSLVTGDWTGWAKHDELCEIEMEFAALKAMRGETYTADFQRTVDLAGFRYDLYNMELKLKDISADATRSAVMRAEARRILVQVVGERAMFKKMFGDSFSRPRPFAIHYVGNPGVGKSNVLEMISRNCLVANGETMPEKLTYTIRDGQEYFDAYVGTEPIVVINDPAIGTKYNENPLNFFIPLLTNESYSPNNAVAEKKETTRASPRIVAMSTNELKLADRFIKTPSAFYRRWHYVVEVAARPEYTTNGVWLDEEKCLADSTGDYYLINIHKWIPDTATQVGVHLEPVMLGAGVRAAMLFLAEQYRRHMERQREIVARLNDRSTDLCSECSVLFAMHPAGCPYGGQRIASGVRSVQISPDDVTVEVPQPQRGHRLLEPIQSEPLPRGTPVGSDGLRLVGPVAVGEHEAAHPAAWAGVGILALLPWATIGFLLLPVILGFCGAAYLLFRAVDLIAPNADMLSRADVAVQVAVATRMAAREMGRRLRGEANIALTPLWTRALAPGKTIQQRLLDVRTADAASTAAPRIAVMGVALVLGAVVAWRLKGEKPRMHDAAGPALSIPRPADKLADVPSLPVVEFPASVRCSPAEQIRIATEQARVTIQGGISTTYGLAIGGQFVLTYAHNPIVRAIRGGHAGPITILRGPQRAVAPRTSHPIQAADVAVLEDRDLAVIRVRGLPPMRKYRYFPESFPPDGAAFMSRVWVGDESEPRAQMAAVYHHHRSLHEFGQFGPFADTPDPIRFGHCGSQLLGERGSVVALAVASNNTTGRSVFAYVTQGDVGLLLSKLGVKSGQEMYAAEPMAEILQLYEDVHMSALSARASVRRVPESYGFINARVVGTMQPFHASADKSKMEHTLLYDDVVKAQPWVEGKWAPPHGKVCDTAKGKLDAYSKMVANVAEQDDSQIDLEVMERAFRDYTDTVVERGCKPWVQRNGRVRPLTLAQAVRGADGIAPLPPGTSSGMPHGGPKRDYYIPDPNEQDPDNYRLDDEALALYMAYVDTLERGEVPSVPAKVFLKLNEVRPAEKVNQAGTRTINALPFPYNVLIKQYFGPLFSTLKGNVGAFEACIGVNMGSHDAARLVAHLLGRELGPTVTKEDVCSLGRAARDAGAIFRDTDARHFDDSFTALKLDYERRFFSEVARAIGYTEREITFVTLIIASLANMCYIIKGDIVQLLKNSSGHGMTAEVNSVMASMLYRYIFFAAKRDGLLPPDAAFADFVRLLTYGDDAACSNLRGADGVVPFERVVAYAREMGFILTPGDKSANPVEWKNLSEITFLKRRFIVDEAEGVVRAPLDEESIWRMLSWRRPSTMDSVRYHVGLISNAQREWWMHGRQRFEEETLWLRAAASRLGVEDLVPWRSYDGLLLEYNEGAFHTWDL